MIKKFLSRFRKEKEFEPKLYPTRDVVLVTTKSDIVMKPCKVNDDNTVEFKTGSRKSKKVKVHHKPSIFTLPLRAIWPHPFLKYWAPRRQHYRAYTLQKEGEFTHNPDTTGVTKESKKRFEEALKLEGEVIEAHLTREAVKDMKDTRSQWFDYIPYICMAAMGVLIVFIMNG